MSLAYFGSQGAYSMDPMNQQVQLMNAYHGAATINGTATTTTFTDTSILGGAYYGGLGLAGMGANVATSPQSLTEYIKQVSAPAKKAARGVLAKLKEEIDGWHGDILERCPA